MQGGIKPEQARFSILLLLVGATYLLGGASRLDVPQLIVLQPLAVLCAIAFLAIPGAIQWRRIRVPLLLLTALAGIMLAQLVPLPPSIWTSLPGHTSFSRSALAAGLEQPWRPISLTPDLTLASLVGLVVPFAALVGFASLPARSTAKLLPVLLISAALSALLGVAQIGGGDRSRAYLFEITNAGSPVGFFANRNHQALLLAMVFPMIAVWVGLSTGDPRRRSLVAGISGAFAIFVSAMVLVTGSRAGLLLALIGLGLAAFHWKQVGVRKHGPISRVVLWSMLAAVLGLTITVLAVLTTSKGVALQRLAGSDGGREVRLEFLPQLLRLTGDFFPIGSGFGSFVPVFEFFEPSDLLQTSYLNHAHNDLLEVTLTGGVPGLALAIGFAAWFIMASFAVWRRSPSSEAAALARAGSAMIGLALLSSLVDYPLRTPLVALLLAVASGWLAGWRDSEGSAAETAILRQNNFTDKPLSHRSARTVGAHSGGTLR